MSGSAGLFERFVKPGWLGATCIAVVVLLAPVAYASDADTVESEEAAVESTNVEGPNGSETTDEKVRGLGDVPAPFDALTMTGQLVTGALILVGTLLVGLLVAFSASPTPGEVNMPRILGGFGVMATAPFLTPLAVNLVGNIHYPNQFLGAHIGSLVGALALGGLSLGGAYALSERHSDMLVLLGIGGGILTGSIVGYHIQANSRYRAAADDNGRRAVVAPAPFVQASRDGSGAGVGVGLGLRGQF